MATRTLNDLAFKKKKKKEKQINGMNALTFNVIHIASLKLDGLNGMPPLRDSLPKATRKTSASAK